MLACQLTGIGMQIGVQDIRAEAAEKVADDISGGAFPLVCDVSDCEACLSAAQTARTRGPLSWLWPEIARTIGQGGGYLICSTDGGETKAAFDARAKEISSSIVEV